MDVMDARIHGYIRAWMYNLHSCLFLSRRLQYICRRVWRMRSYGIIPLMLKVTGPIKWYTIQFITWLSFSRVCCWCYWHSWRGLHSSMFQFRFNIFIEYCYTMLSNIITCMYVRMCLIWNCNMCTDACKLIPHICTVHAYHSICKKYVLWCLCTYAYV